MLMDLDTPEADNEHFCLEKMAVTWFAKHEVFTHSLGLQKHGSNTNATSHFGFPLLVKTVGVSEVGKVGFGAPDIPGTWQRPKRLVGQDQQRDRSNLHYVCSI
jgi:uncharacterized membrane protein (UPF0182 family)